MAERDPRPSLFSWSEVVEPTWDTLAPLLKHEAPTAPEVVDRCLQLHLPFIQQTVDRFERRDHRDECLAWVFERLVRRLRLRGGLTRNGGEGSAAGWLRQVVINLCRDWWRREEALRRADNLKWVGHREPARPHPEDWFEDLCGRESEAVERLLARPLDTLVPPQTTLAWIARHLPERIPRALVDAAATYVPGCGTRGGRIGLARDAETTWSLLQAWQHRHGDDPRSVTGHVHLAWILRASDTTSPEVWRVAHPRAAARTRDVVRKWSDRASEKLSLPCP